MNPGDVIGGPGIMVRVPSERESTMTLLWQQYRDHIKDRSFKYAAIVRHEIEEWLATEPPPMLVRAVTEDPPPKLTREMLEWYSTEWDEDRPEEDNDRIIFDVETYLRSRWQVEHPAGDIDAAP